MRWCGGQQWIFAWFPDISDYQDLLVNREFTTETKYFCETHYSAIPRTKKDIEACCGSIDAIHGARFAGDFIWSTIYNEFGSKFGTCSWLDFCEMLFSYYGRKSMTSLHPYNIRAIYFPFLWYWDLWEWCSRNKFGAVKKELHVFCNMYQSRSKTVVKLN